MLSYTWTWQEVAEDKAKHPVSELRATDIIDDWKDYSNVQTGPNFSLWAVGKS